MGSVAIIDYGSGNLRSAENALIRASQDAGGGQTILVTSDPDAVGKAERIVLPGVGAFGDCMAGLAAIPGMVEVITDAVHKRGVPFLGVCVGMQLLADWGREHGDHKGLGWIPGEVVKLTPSDPSLKIPHMGWNALRQKRPHFLLDGTSRQETYFVHSYALCAEDTNDVVADTDYGGAFVSVVGRDNIAGTQFHPEKSQTVGLALLGRFLKWKP